MADRISRREFALKASVALAGMAVLPAARAQDAPPQTPVSDAEVAAIESQLAKPLTPEARDLLKTAVRYGKEAHANRLKMKLPENSEPCTVYVPEVRR